MFYPEIRLSVHHGVLVPNVSSLCSWLPVLPSIFLPISFPRSHIIKVLWYIITVHIYLKSPLGEYAASPPLLSLRIIKCYYLHPASSIQLLSQPLITSTALNKKNLTNDLRGKLETEKKKTTCQWRCSTLNIWLDFPAVLVNSNVGKLSFLLAFSSELSTRSQVLLSVSSENNKPTQRPFFLHINTKNDDPTAGTSNCLPLIVRKTCFTKKGTKLVWDLKHLNVLWYADDAQFYVSKHPLLHWLVLLSGFYHLKEVGSCFAFRWDCWTLPSLVVKVICLFSLFMLRGETGLSC